MTACKTFYDQQTCQFPFTYDGESFDDCTDKGTPNGFFFCGTGGGNYGACNRNCDKTSYSGLSICFVSLTMTLRVMTF